MNKQHQKHAKLAKPAGGDWCRSELALLGAPCAVIREIAEKVIARLKDNWNIGFADADHHPQPKKEFGAAAVHFSDRGAYQQIDVANGFTRFDHRALFNACDLVLMNGHHFNAQQQILFIHPQKSLESRLAQLTDVQLIILAGESMDVPDYLQATTQNVPIINLKDEAAIISFFEGYLIKNIPPLNGLVLAGGQSLRMGRDKSLLQYHGKPQLAHVSALLQPLCEDVFISCNASQSAGIDLPKIEDRFLDIGPMSGLLSAFQFAPNTAWLSVATDLPHLSRKTLDYLIAHRNPSKLATAFVGDGNIPEPLITIWEPRAYPVLLQALGMGISCPRKALMSSDVELLEPPSIEELQNINLPAERDAAIFAIHNGSVAHSG